MMDEAKGRARARGMVGAEEVADVVAELRRHRSFWVKGVVETGTFDDPMTLGGVPLDEAIFGTILSSAHMDTRHVVGRVRITVELLEDRTTP